MDQYYTKPCNFYFGKNSINTVYKGKALPLHGNKLISFGSLEILTRKKSKIIEISDVKFLSKKFKYKIKKDLKNITKKKKFKNLKFSISPILMGVINLTPDSFSDGGKYNKKKLSIMRAKNLIKSGSAILDIGGESTRPGSNEVNEVVEWRRIKDFLKNRKKLNSLISIDTRKKTIMEKAFKYEIDLINDVSGMSHDSNTINFLKKSKIPFIIHHMQGTPNTMQKKPKYKNVVLDIYDFFCKKIHEIRTKGIKHNNIILDPGIGFGKNLKHNITILNQVSIFHSLGFPVMLGISRKRFIKDLARNNDSKERIGGTISSSIWAMTQGVQVLRIHDVNEVKQAIRVFKSLHFL